MVSFYRYHRHGNYHDFKTFLLGEFRHSIFEQNIWFYSPQREMLCNADGEIIVDYVGCFETLQEDFDHVCRKIGLPLAPVPHINSAVARENGNRPSPKKLRGKVKRLLRWRPNRHPPRYDRYQEYYDQDCVDYVAEIYAADIELFGYTFD